MNRSKFLKTLAGISIAPKILLASKIEKPMVEEIAKLPAIKKSVAIYGSVFSEDVDFNYNTKTDKKSKPKKDKKVKKNKKKKK